ncbi:MAG TPA: DUF3798 domain-containing protein [Candidatus Enterocloster faecavium]|uniref:DUF3798 domain-containing protein n=1 Tax=Candidatus Enterocloster faecavium TaxID=2838560 RepID=A0A9D2L7U2_9FIRM|nr:DUF3798 domain-containing protein [Candidatus Enterocloster faecavium]
MKRVLAWILTLALTVGLCACGSGETAENGNSQSSSGENTNFKIGIMTDTVSATEENYRAAQTMKEKYGDMIVTATYPDKSSELETTISNALSLASDPDVKAIVFCQAIEGTTAAIQQIKEKRPDMLCIVGGMTEDPAVIGAEGVADICLQKATEELGIQMVEGAKKMGAERLIHYSFPRQMAMQVIHTRYEAIKEKCAELGMDFIEVTTPDTQSDAGVAGTQQFVLEDVRRKIEEYGPDTAFYATAVAMNEPMIKAVVEGKAIYVLQSDPSPFNGYPAALGIEIPEDKKGDFQYGLQQIKKKADELGMSDRLSTWSFAVYPMFICAGVEYAKAWCEGKTDGKVDIDVLQQKMKEYAQSDITFSNYTDNSGNTMENVVFVTGELVDFTTFGQSE